MAKKRPSRQLKVWEMPLGHQAFVQCITDPTNKLTYNSSKRAYQAAYPNCSPNSAKASGCRLLTKATIKQAIEQKRRLMEQAEHVDANFVKGEHLRLLRLSEEKGDLPTATRNVEGLGKSVGAYKGVREDYLFLGHRPEDAIQVSEDKRRAFIESQEVAEKPSSLPADGQTTGTKL